MLCVFCCYAYVSILQCSMTRTVIINAFQIFYIFFRAVPNVQLSIMFIFKSSIARQRINIRHYVYCLAVLWTISCLVACMYLSRCKFIAHPILPALSLHALSELALFTCRFHYPRNPYPQNDHYPQFHYTRIKSPRLTAALCAEVATCNADSAD